MRQMVYSHTFSPSISQVFRIYSICIPHLFHRNVKRETGPLAGANIERARWVETETGE